MEIYEIDNPLFLSGVFVFGEIDGVGMCYIRVNICDQIEEIGVDIQKRMNNKPIKDIMESSRQADEDRKRVFNSISPEYWIKIWKSQLRQTNIQTYIENNSGMIIM